VQEPGPFSCPQRGRRKTNVAHKPIDSPRARHQRRVGPTPVAHPALRGREGIIAWPSAKSPPGECGAGGRGGAAPTRFGRPGRPRTNKAGRWPRVHGRADKQASCTWRSGARRRWTWPGPRTFATARRAAIQWGDPSRRRFAIYSRNSSEEWLEQEPFPPLAEPNQPGTLYWEPPETGGGPLPAARLQSGGNDV
jgi:hypothetical protein